MSQSTNATQQVANAMTTSRQATGGGSQIPDLLKIGQIPTSTLMTIETDVLEPVVKSDNFIRFQVQNKGIWHSHSKIEFCYKDIPSNVNLPVGVGIHSLIQRATLKCGGKTICEVDDYNQFASYQSNFLSPEALKEREQFLSGRIANSLNFEYTDRTPTNDNVDDDRWRFSFGSSQQTNNASKGLRIDNGMDMVVATSTGAPADPSTMVGGPNLVESYNDYWYWASLWRSALGTRGSQNPRWQIAVSDLFPFLKTNQLPLYMLKEPLSLELVLSEVGTATAGSKRCQGSAGNVACPLDTTKIRMISDHIYYPQEMMEQYASANKNLQFTYVDYRLSKYSVDSTDLQSQGIRNIGGAGRIISKVFWGISDSNSDDATLLSGYSALAPDSTYTSPQFVAADTNGTTTLNLKMNDNFLFPIDVSNSARHFHNVVQGEGKVPYMSRQVYANQGNSLTDRSRFGKPDQGFSVYGSLTGSQFYHCFRLNRGERVNSRGIELYFKQGTPGGAGTTGAQTQRVWLETLRVATLQNGVMECYYA
jgi:hypothetical protein